MELINAQRRLTGRKNNNDMFRKKSARSPEAEALGLPRGVHLGTRIDKKMGRKLYYVAASYPSAKIKKQRQFAYVPDGVEITRSSQRRLSDAIELAKKQRTDWLEEVTSGKSASEIRYE